jgi:nonribosomal peptide synthetase DhbF
MFMRNVARRPDSIAITDGAREIRYRDLYRAAQKLRAVLADEGVGAGELVGISLERGWKVAAAILAVLGHGCGYVPLDPSYPERRLAFMAEDSGIEVAIVDEACGALPPHVRRVSPEAGRARSNQELGAVPRPQGTPAYVIYTSGSTGSPKGVEVLERGVLELFRSCAGGLFSFGPDDVWSWFHSYSFDFSVWEMWGALIYGGRIVMVPEDVARRPSTLLQLLSAEGITVLSQVPSSFKYLAKAYERRPAELSLRYVVFGGEALDRPSLRRWTELRSGAEALINMYGITETTVHATFCRVGPRQVAHDSGGTPIGLPLRHLTFALLDDHDRPVPVGERGEIHIAGSSLAKGYLGRPELTRRRFPTLSVNGVTRRWYRSGDVARQLPDGSYEYIGRNDRQISLRGFRVELGEVEALLRRSPEVLDALADAEEVAGGEVVLVAYVVPADPLAAADGIEASIRWRCAAEFPAHMVPNRIVVIAELPRTPSGKLDRSRLSELAVTRRPSPASDRTAPRS